MAVGCWGEETVGGAKGGWGNSNAGGAEECSRAEVGRRGGSWRV